MISRETWLRAACIGLAVFAVALTALILIRPKPDAESTTASEASAVFAPRLVETLGAGSPIGNHEDEQFAVRSFEAANGAGGFTGWAGSAPDRGRLKVFWKGTLPVELRGRLEELSKTLPVEVYSTKFSQAELTEAMDRVRGDIFEAGACSATTSYGVDAIQFETDRDLSSLNVPLRTSEGIPIVVTQGECPDPT